MRHDGERLRLGVGAGFASDRIQPAVELAESAELDFLIFECLAERTMAMAQLRRERGLPGYDPMLETRLRAVLPSCWRNGVRIITNMGGAGVLGALELTVQVARELGFRGLRVACIEGDDVLRSVDDLTPFDEEPLPQARILAANAYLGAEALLPALEQEAHVILTGRVADPSLFVAPAMHRFGWQPEDWDRLGAGTALGHLLECAGQLTGGYFADPPYKMVPDLANLGFPFAEVEPDGSATLQKLANSGGVLNLQTCREQLLYEVMDPSCYVTPDVVADFTGVRLTTAGPDMVRVEGARGTARPERYKVSLGTANGYFGEAQISYAGGGARARAELARSILTARLSAAGLNHLHCELIGMNALHGAAPPVWEPYEVRLRAAAQFSSAPDALLLTHEAESLYLNGPAGGAGIVTAIRESVAIYSALIARDRVDVKTHVETA